MMTVLRLVLEWATVSPLILVPFMWFGYIWLQRDIKGLREDMRDMKSELREDHGNLAGKVDRLSDKVSGIDVRLARKEGILEK